MPQQKRKWGYGETIRKLNDIGFIGKTWPAERILVGICVSRWLRVELLESQEGKEIFLTESTGSTRWPLDGSILSRSLRLLHNYRISLTAHVRSVQEQWGRGFLRPVGELPWLPGLQDALESEGSSLVENLVRVKLSSRRYDTPCQAKGLGLDHCRKLGKILESCSRLRSLGLFVEDKGLAALSGFFRKSTSLTELTFDDCSIEDSGSFEHLNYCTNLLLLRIGGYVAEPVQLIDTLRCLTTLTDLDLGDGQYWHNEARVVQGLLRHTRLTSLNFENTVSLNMDVGMFDMNDEDHTPVLAQVIANNAKNLTFLNLCGVNLGEGFRWLAPVLGECTLLESLGLYDNRIQTQGAQHLAAVRWEECRALHSIDLQENALKSAGVETAAQAVARSPSLRRLFLGRNGASKAAYRTAAAHLPPLCRVNCRGQSKALQTWLLLPRNPSSQLEGIL